MNTLTTPSLIACSIEAGKKSQDCKMITFAFGATLITVNKKINNGFLHLWRQVFSAAEARSESLVRKSHDKW